MYEDKNYKKALKKLDEVLGVHADHGESMAVKALIKNQMGDTVEAMALVNQALMFDLKSPMSWHLYGSI